MFSPAFQSTRDLAAFRLRRNTLNLLGLGSGLYLATESSQRFPAGVAWTLIAVARLAVPVLAAAWAKSFAIRLAQCSDWQRQKHLLPQHIFKQQTVSLIIPDFCFRRSNRPLGRLGIGFGGAEDEVEFGGQGNFHRLDAAGAWDLELAREITPKSNVCNDILWSAVLVQHLGLACCGQLANLLGLFAQIDRARSQLQVKVDWFPFQFNYLEFHSLSVRRRHPRVNEGEQGTGIRGQGSDTPAMKTCRRITAPGGQMAARRVARPS